MINIYVDIETTGIWDINDVHDCVRLTPLQ